MLSKALFISTLSAALLLSVESKAQTGDGILKETEIVSLDTWDYEPLYSSGWSVARFLY